MHGSPVTSPVARLIEVENVEPMEQKNAGGKMRRGTSQTPPPPKKRPPTPIKFSLTAIWTCSLLLVLMMVLVRLMSCLAGKKKKKKIIPSSSLPSLMSKAECHFLAAGHKSHTSYIVMRSLRWRALDVGPTSLAK